MYTYPGGSRPDLYEKFAVHREYLDTEGKPVPSLTANLPNSDRVMKIVSYYKNLIYIAMDINPIACSLMLFLGAFFLLGIYHIVKDIIRLFLSILRILCGCQRKGDRDTTNNKSQIKSVPVVDKKKKEK